MEGLFAKFLTILIYTSNKKRNSQFHSFYLNLKNRNSYKMKRKILSLFIVLLSGFSFAQETIPLYQQYLLNSEFLFNPAYFGNTDDVVFMANYQKQFSKFDESPNVQSVGLHANIFDRVGAGAYFFRDQNGPISANGIAIGASYFVPLSDDDGRKDQFSFGTSVNFYNQSFDFSKVNAEDPNDPLLYESNNSIFIAYANLGLQATYKGAFAGVSVADIPLTNNIPVVNGIEPSPTRFYLNAGYDWFVSDGFSVSPSMMLNLNTNSSRMLDLNLQAKFYGEENFFAAGVSYRTSNSTLGGQQLSLSPFVNVKANRFRFGATYNLGLSDIQQYGGNSFMIGLGYDLPNFINSRGFRYR